MFNGTFNTKLGHITPVTGHTTQNSFDCSTEAVTNVINFMQYQNIPNLYIV